MMETKERHQQEQRIREALADFFGDSYREAEFYYSRTKKGILITYDDFKPEREIKEKVAENESNPLKGKKIAAYYGCLLLRPSKVMAMDDAENPSIMEDFIKAIGAVPVVYPYRNECCGGYVVVDDPASAKKKSAAVLDSASGMGAELIVTACPLCKYNLAKSGDALPVVYLTELLAEALGVKEA